jgi:hypothetical protein
LLRRIRRCGAKVRNLGRSGLAATAPRYAEFIGHEIQKARPANAGERVFDLMRQHHRQNGVMVN